MKRILSAVLAAVFICSVMTVFTSCHGSRLAADFTLPQEFDTSKNPSDAKKYDFEIIGGGGAGGCCGHSVSRG